MGPGPDWLDAAELAEQAAARDAWFAGTATAAAGEIGARSGRERRPALLLPPPRPRKARALMPAPLVLAVPKGRILAEALPLLARAGIRPEPAFGDEDSRALRFATDDPGVELIRVRAFDVATFVAHGAAQLGIVGSDVLGEFGFSELYAPVDLGIGHCRLSLAEPAGAAAGDGDREDPRGWSHVRVATKYPRLTAAHFARAGVQAECIKLNGAMELAPILGLAPRIVDLVSSGRTLRENGLVEVAVIQQVSARLVVNRAAMKTRPELVAMVDAFRAAVAAEGRPTPVPERGEVVRRTLRSPSPSGEELGWGMSSALPASLSEQAPPPPPPLKGRGEEAP